MTPVGVIDCGIGNLQSVVGAIEKLKFEARLVSAASEIGDYEKLILPGVGAFGRGMTKLRERGMVDAIRDHVTGGGCDLLGICLGMQLLADRSEEFGNHEGLGLISGEVKRIRSDDAALRVPHVGWNRVHSVDACPLFRDVPAGSYFYHVHSYVMVPADESVICARCCYGETFVTAVRSGNVYGTQFHPEKSQLHGLKVIENFLETPAGLG